MGKVNRLPLFPKFYMCNIIKNKNENLHINKEKENNRKLKGKHRKQHHKVTVCRVASVKVLTCYILYLLAAVSPVISCRHRVK